MFCDILSGEVFPMDLCELAFIGDRANLHFSSVR